MLVFREEEVQICGAHLLELSDIVIDRTFGGKWVEGCNRNECCFGAEGHIYAALKKTSLARIVMMALKLEGCVVINLRR